MEQAIRKACTNGYKGDPHYLINLPDYAKCQIWLDPFFWQALGKALGWKENYGYGWFVKVSHGGAWEWRQFGDKEVFWGGKPNEYPNVVTFKEAWSYHWHNFIDHLASGKDAESFFKNLTEQES